MTRRRAAARPASPRRAHDALGEAFLARSVPALQHLVREADASTLRNALAAPSDVGGIARLVSDLLGSTLQVDAVDPLAAAIARGARQKEKLLARAGGAFTSTQVAKFLGISRQAVDKRRQSYALLAVPTGTGDYRYPKCQFTTDGAIPGLERVLRAFLVTGPWTRLSALLGPSDALGRRSILEALRAGDIDEAVAAASGVGEQGA